MKKSLWSLSSLWALPVLCHSAVVSLLSARRFTTEHCTILDRHHPRTVIQWQAICGRPSHASTPIFTRGIRVLSSAIWTSPSKCRETNELAKVARGNCQKELPPLPVGKPNTKITKINRLHFCWVTLQGLRFCLTRPGPFSLQTIHGQPMVGDAALRPESHFATQYKSTQIYHIVGKCTSQCQSNPQMNAADQKQLCLGQLTPMKQRRGQKTWKATLASDQSKTLSIPTTGMVYSPKANSFKK